MPKKKEKKKKQASMMCTTSCTAMSYYMYTELICTNFKIALHFRRDLAGVKIRIHAICV